MTVRKLKGYLRRHWPKIKQALLDGTYDPMPVRRTEIDKPDGGVRLLGIPTALDRLVQQAIAQVLGQLWDHTFSEFSYGFRPGRSAAQALRRCRTYLEQGYRYVVDLDLAKFFDRVPQDRLMSRLATRVTDKRVLRLIRRFLHSGVMINGLVSPTEEGTPQGGPLSPLLSNIVLDELDKELEKRGLHFVRYADDCVIYVRSERAGNRVMESVTRFVQNRLKLQVNHEKSAVGRPWDRKYLGFCFTNSRTAPKLRIHWKTIQRFRQRVRDLTGRTRGRSLRQIIGDLVEYIRGWWGYFGITESFNRLRPLSHWVRRRLRALVWYQWKNRRTRVRELRKRGVSRKHALTTGVRPQGAVADEHGQVGRHRTGGCLLRIIRTVLPVALTRHGQPNRHLRVLQLKDGVGGALREGRPYPDQVSRCAAVVNSPNKRYSPSSCPTTFQFCEKTAALSSDFWPGSVRSIDMGEPCRGETTLPTSLRTLENVLSAQTRTA